jgi:prepilin peptidase CpaA
MVIRQRFARKEGRPEIPYGVAIAFAGLWLIGQRFLYQFG